MKENRPPDSSLILCLFPSHSSMSSAGTDSPTTRTPILRSSFCMARNSGLISSKRKGATGKKSWEWAINRPVPSVKSDGNRIKESIATNNGGKANLRNCLFLLRSIAELNGIGLNSAMRWSKLATSSAWSPSLVPGRSAANWSVLISLSSTDPNCLPINSAASRWVNRSATPTSFSSG